MVRVVMNDLEGLRLRVGLWERVVDLLLVGLMDMQAEGEAVEHQVLVREGRKVLDGLIVRVGLLDSVGLRERVRLFESVGLLLRVGLTVEERVASASAGVTRYRSSAAAGPEPRRNC